MAELPSDNEVRRVVRETLDTLPDAIARELAGVAIIVEERHPADLMGIYDPTGGLQRIVIFREANPNLDEVRRTVLHEVGHHFGMTEEQLAERGYG